MKGLSRLGQERGTGLKSMRRGNVLVGCLVAAGVVILLIIVGVVILVMNWRSIATSGMRAVSEAAITSMDDQGLLPAGEGPEMITELDHFFVAFKDGTVTAEGFQSFAESMEDETVFTVGLIYGIELKYLNGSSLSEERKSEGAEALQRLAVAKYRGALTQSDLGQIFDPMLYPAGQSGNSNVDTRINGRELKAVDQITEEDWDAIIAAAVAKADEAGVPEGMYRIDLSEALGREIDILLGEDPRVLEGIPELGAPEAVEEAVEEPMGSGMGDE